MHQMSCRRTNRKVKRTKSKPRQKKNRRKVRVTWPQRTTRRLLFPFVEKKKKTEAATRKGDKEYGVSRGIDFYRVANIINFDFPTDFDAYVHRVGRTARIDQKGT